MASFTELETWKQARKIRIKIASITKSFSLEEKFRLSDQLIRCSRSIGNNIRKGMGVFTTRQDNICF
ncbi:MAG: four helix bundle protein [Mucilaginibacter sp.]